MSERFDSVCAALSDRYTIERELGRGGMATVYLVRDVKHDRQVALKVLLPQLAVSEERTERFLREIRIAAKLSHPHILPVHDSGEAGGLLYYVMPNVCGRGVASSLSPMPTLAQRRLQHQYLAAPTLPDAVAVVRALGAVQAQDYGGARWAIAQRTTGVTEADVERAIASGAILRTHVLRPTWHLVLRDDARWMLELTAPRVRAAMAYYHRKWELDAKVCRKSDAAMERALRDGQHLTRSELAVALQRTGLDVSAGERVGHLLMQAELDRVIISGARRGKQLTYALFDTRVPAAPARDRDEALHELTRRYFATRGPATLQDFAWWSGLTVADARRGVEAAAGALVREMLDGDAYWHAPSAGAARRASRIAHLLPNYDEYFIGFKDRSAFDERLRRTAAGHRLNALRGHILFVDGQIVGGWRRTLGTTVEVVLELLVPLTASERQLVRRAAARFGEFLEAHVRTRTA